MFYQTGTRDHGLPHDPFKALVAPRPIGWIGTVSPEGVANLAPYSYFNAMGDRPPVVVFSSAGRKDSLRNIEASGEFTCSLSTYALREQMNLSSAPVAPGVDEFEIAGLDKRASQMISAPGVAQSPAVFECKLWKTLDMPTDPKRPENVHTMVIGIVVAIYIDDRYIRDGRVDTAAIQPLARLGYMDYAVVNAQSMFELNRPLVGEDGKTLKVETGKWDGVYR